MVIVRFQGGLGNQLFQYALYRKYELLGFSVKADVRYYKETPKGDTIREFDLDKLNTFPLKIATEAEILLFVQNENSSLWDRVYSKLFNKTFYDIEPYEFTPSIFKQKNLYLNGYWQDYRYFKDIWGVIQNEFTFKASQKAKNRQLEEAIRNKNSVSVHIRRGDYQTLMNIERYGNVCGLEYYQCAIAMMEEKLSAPYFYFFSDEPNWVLQNFKMSNMSVVTCNQLDESYYDMHLMSCCKHNIIANSTYSWWAAIMNKNQEKIVCSSALGEYKKEIPNLKRVEGWTYLKY